MTLTIALVLMLGSGFILGYMTKSVLLYFQYTQARRRHARMQECVIDQCRTAGPHAHLN